MSAAEQITWERVTAADLGIGDRIAKVRTDPPVQVEVVESVGESSRWIRLTSGRIRPRHTAKFWRVIERGR